MKWEIEDFNPSDGSKQMGVTVDHRAWLRGSDEDEESTNPPVHININMSSKGVSEEQAKQYFEAMVHGLNSMK